MSEEESKTVVSVVFKATQTTIDYYLSDEVPELVEDLEDDLEGHQGTYRKTEIKDNVYWEFLSQGHTWVALTIEHDNELISELNVAFDLAVASTKETQINYN